ncbi:anti-adapter protein iraM [Enterobacter sp.]|uniref:anti-adapter protein iraM n=1 Tax=Enterobacter sp. TaxID=42895 RepID=UPI00296EEAAB|nr:anti-adapter protein iraM [Enterobacter sp.]
MEWFVKQALACPKTGTAFAVVSGVRNLDLILWYRGDYFLHKGNTLSTTAFGIVANDRKRDIYVIHAFPFSPSLWASFSNNIQCPGNTEPFIHGCTKKTDCRFKHCPYGAMPEH